MGEQLAPDEFRIAGCSFSRRGGSISSFTRDMRVHQRRLEKFFRKTGHDFRRFNYLGEWHSHPHFPVMPSTSDVAAMRAIVDDRVVGATFATLLIVRLRNEETLEVGPYLFVPGKRLPYPIECLVDYEKTDSNTQISGIGEPGPVKESPPIVAVGSAPREDADSCGC